MIKKIPFLKEEGNIVTKEAQARFKHKNIKLVCIFNLCRIPEFFDALASDA